MLIFVIILLMFVLLGVVVVILCYIVIIVKSVINISGCCFICCIFVEIIVLGRIIDGCVMCFGLNICNFVLNLEFDVDMIVGILMKLVVFDFDLNVGFMLLLIIFDILGSCFIVLFFVNLLFFE